MDFRYESEMTELVEDWLLKQDMQVKREYPMPWGICDLVACSLNKNRVKKRLRFGQKRPIGSQFRILLLSYIPDIEQQMSINFSELYRQLESFLDKSFVEKEIARLIKDRFIQEVRPNVFQKLNGWFPLHKRIVAVELKLARISEVLSQARSNLEFTDESYVGLPLNRAKELFAKRENRGLMEKGIGLLGIGQEGVKVLLRSRSRNESNQVLKMHCAERFWKDHFKEKRA